MDEVEIEIYFSTLDHLLNEKRSTREIRWLELFDVIDVNNSENLSKLLALVHPHNYDDKLKRVHIDEELKKYFVNDRFDNSTLLRTSKCQIGYILDIHSLECPHKKSIQQDHHWPFSLGGPTLRENRVHLCQECNVAKSNSPFFFKHQGVPNWLKQKLQLIRQLLVS